VAATVRASHRVALAPGLHSARARERTDAVCDGLGRAVAAVPLRACGEQHQGLADRHTWMGRRSQGQQGQRAGSWCKPRRGSGRCSVEVACMGWFVCVVSSSAGGVLFREVVALDYKEPAAHRKVYQCPARRHWRLSRPAPVRLQKGVHLFKVTQVSPRTCTLPSTCQWRTAFSGSQEQLRSAQKPTAKLGLLAA
jgi:hypothetical protein